MSAKRLPNIENCPFWSAQSMKCRICKGGLFIPLDDHIDVYCKTPDFPQCLQYAMHSDGNIQSSELTRQAHINRRRFQRIEACHKVTLVRLVNSGKIVSHFSTIANTLDMSSGGMRLISEKPLVADSIIQFKFDDAFPTEVQNGSGQVAWCNKQIDYNGYQAGISFQDDHLIEAMGLYLGNYHNNM